MVLFFWYSTKEVLDWQGQLAGLDGQVALLMRITLLPYCIASHNPKTDTIQQKFIFKKTISVITAEMLFDIYGHAEPSVDAF